MFDVLKSNTTNHDIYGVCKPISKESKYFDYGIAMKYDGGDVPEGYKVWDVHPTLWGVFKCVGENGDFTKLRLYYVR